MSEKFEFSKAVLDGPLEFFAFGMHRSVARWVPPIEGLPAIHLGPGSKMVHGTTDIEFPEYDLESDILPFGDESVGAVFATHVLEHLADPLHIIGEAARVLAFGGAMTILVPHAQSRSFLQDLDHKTPFVLDTWKNALDSTYYSKGKANLPLRLGFNMTMAVKEDNTAIVTQLIKV